MKRRILATVLTLVMLFTTLSPIPAFAADDASEQLATGVTGGTFTDTTADADSAYEYTITGTDGSVQTLTVDAQSEDGDDAATGNRVTGPHEGVTDTYYALVTDLSDGIPAGTYLLVNNGKAMTSEYGGGYNWYLGLQNVTIENNCINTEDTTLEWTVSGSNGSYSFLGSNGKYLNINYDDLLSNSLVYVTVAISGNTIELEGVSSGDVISLVFGTYATTDYTDDGTDISLYRKVEATGGATYYTVDTTGLNALIAEYSALDSRNYTAGSWTNFQNALDAAKALQNPTDRFESAEAAQSKLDEVNAAQTALVAAYEALEQLETFRPTMSWTRTQDDTTNTVYGIPYSNTDAATTVNGVEYAQFTALTWDWSSLTKLINDQETKQEQVWNYENTLGISAADINTGAASWEAATVHKISGTFDWPEDYALGDTTITLQSVNDEYYAPIYDYITENSLSDNFPNGKVFPVNDDVYVVMWAEDDNTTVTAENINDYLLFWTGTSGKGLWSKNGYANNDWARTTPATFLSASRQGVRAFYQSKPNTVGTTADNAINANVENMSSSVVNYLMQSDGWYTLTDTTAINSVMRNNYPNGIAAGTKVHLDLYVFNNDGQGGIDELEIVLAKKPETETDVTVNYYYGSVTTPNDANAFLGSATLTNIPYGTEITLASGTNAAQLNYMKAAAITKSSGLVTNGAQQGNVPYVVRKGIDNVINVLYLPDAVNAMTYTFDFGMTNTYTGVLTANELSTVTSVELVNNGFNASFDLDSNTISFTPAAATTNRAMVTLKLTLNNSTTVDMPVYFVAASNVYYEENFITTAADSGWVKNGNAATVTIADNMDTVYGYTDSYKTSVGANGVYETTVSADKKNSGDLNFSFSGTGFDLLATCGPETGTLMVRVNDASGNYVKAFVVDTAFEDATYGTIHQVPLIHEQDLAHGNYQLVIRGAYIDYSASASTASTFGLRGGSSSAIDDLYELMYGMGLTDEQIDSVEFISVDTNGAATYAAETDAAAPAAAPASMNLNVDAIRVYKPTNNASYVTDEQGVTYYNVLDAVYYDSFIAYIEATASGEYKVTAYEDMGGPQNEIYLANGQSIALKVDGVGPIQASLRNVNGAANAAIMGNNITIGHNTEMYYEVTPGTDGIVTIQNTGNALLAVCNLKFAATTAIDYLVEDDYPTVYAMLRNTSAEPEEPVEPECGGTACEYAQVAAKAATCAEGGNLEHWYCAEHDRYYVMGENGLTPANATDVLTNPDPNNHVGETELRNESETYTGDLHCVACGAMLQKGEIIEPEVPEVEGFKPAKMSAKTSAISFFGRKFVTLTVTTSSDVQYITVNGQKVTSRSFFWGYSKTKTFVLTNVYAYNATANFEIVAYNSDGVASEALSVKR